MAERCECALDTVCAVVVVAAFAGETGGIGALQTVGLQVLAFAAGIRRTEIVVVDAARKTESS